MALWLPPTGEVGEDRYQPLAEINVTPMVDVMLVLLVIFMVTAPLLTVGVPLDLPKTSAAQVTQPQEPISCSTCGTRRPRESCGASGAPRSSIPTRGCSRFG